MNRNWFYVIAVLTLPLLRVLVLNTHYGEWLLNAHYDQASAFILGLRDSQQFQAFIGGWIFPVFVAGTLIYWCMEEDKERIPMQFLLLPLFYIPLTIVGFTLLNADFEISYLYVNTLLVLTFGYLYVLAWVGFIALLAKVKLIQ